MLKLCQTKGRDCRWIDCRGNGQSMIGSKRSNSISRCWSEHAIDWSGVITIQTARIALCDWRLLHSLLLS